MRIYSRGLTLTIGFLTLNFALALVAWSGSANQGVSSQEAKKQETTPQDDVPVLDIKQAEKEFSWYIWGRAPALPVEQKQRNCFWQDYRSPRRLDG